MIGKILKWFFATLFALLLLSVGVALIVWMNPGKILTSERVSGWVAPLVRFERDPKAAFPNAPLVSLEITPDGFWRRTIAIRLAPGCYALASEPKGGTEACLTTADLSFSIRVSKRTYLKLTALEHLEIRISRGRFVAGKTAIPEAKTEAPGTGFGYLHYLDRGFTWGPIAIKVDQFEIPSAKLEVAAAIESAEVDHRGLKSSPKLAVSVHADNPEWNASVDGEIFQKGDILNVPKASVAFRTKAKKGENDTLRLAGEVAGTYVLSSGDLDGDFSVIWRAPTPEIESLKAEDGKIRMRENELSAHTTLKALLQGKTPLGRLPILTVDVGAAVHPAEKSGSRPIDIDLKIDAYEFAGIRAHSDLSVSLVPSKGANEIRYRKGELRVETPDFAKTIALLSKTSWAIPTPFNVFRGPMVFHTEPFRETEDRTTIPAVFSTDLTSTEQTFNTETKFEIDIAKKDFAILRLKIDALLKKMQFRLPDYEPLAPVPSLARDSRIIRYVKPKTYVKGQPDPKTKLVPAPKPSGAPFKKPTGFPVLVSVKGGPGSIALLNRFFDPVLLAGIDLSTDSDSGALAGSVTLSTPFRIHYLNRAINLERLDLKFRPAVETVAVISMDRSGYHISATLHQGDGKTQVSLSSSPPLQDDEIVSLLLYGMPKNSISSEQSRSVGSAQAAMGSEALGIFSFWAFASTPIESVLYDPATQTYSAVVSLPGGVTASIGSSWENERQLALSKSLGRNWAVSTEIIKDASGVDRGGTLLRWRKSY
jgi:hypothetical protein